ncbi:lipopolysaccharide biosynthesis protein [Ruminococcus bromii]|uniref:lipopolysaccharide biosynthesis protein n=1 Tax=Ruminococcus bromii TaxID=40518 RepID=UPI00267614EF|nr:oligosaccharide flippase family protein [Ruminococcus bromii]
MSNASKENGKNIKASAFYLVGNLFNKALAFFTIPIFTRILTTSEYGISQTYLSWVSILTLIVGLSLGNSIRTAYVDFHDDIEGYMSSIYGLSLLSFLASSALIITGMLIWGDIDIILVICCLVQSYFQFVATAMTTKYMMKVDYIRKTLLLALPNLTIQIIAIFTIMNMHGDKKYFGYIIPYAAIYMVVGIYFVISSFIRGKKPVNKLYWKYALTYSLPLIFHGLSLVLLSSSDRIMITNLYNSSETGVYSLIYNLSMVAMAVTASLEAVWVPWFTRKLMTGEKSTINKNITKYLEISLVVMLCLMFVAPEIVKIMATEQYYSGIYMIPPLVFASYEMYMYTVYVNVEYYYKSTKYIAFNTIVAAVTNIVLNFIFVPLYGGMAACFTTVASYMVSFIMHSRHSRKLDKELFPLKQFAVPTLIFILAIIVAYLLMELWIARWIIAIVGFICYAAYALLTKRFSNFLK